MELLILLIIFVLMMFLQIKLCKSKKRVLGLVIPSLTFVLSVVTPVIMYLFINGIIAIDNVGFIIMGSEIGLYFLVFFVFNIPTAISLIIYFTKKRRS